MVRNNDLRVRISLNEKRQVQELAKLEHKSMAQLVRDRLFNTNKPEILFLVQEIHKHLIGQK